MVLDLYLTIRHTVPIFKPRRGNSALRTKEKTAKNRHSQTQKETAEEQTQEQIKN